MQMMKWTRGVLLVLSLTFSGTNGALANDIQTGIAALERGDYQTAFRLFRSLADQGDTDAQTNLGFMYDNGQGVPQDYVQAVAWYRKAADQGNASAQTNLGIMYRNGQGVPQDYIQAVAWYRRAADQGYAQAQSSLGFMYHNGRGVPQDYAQAVAWFRKAADQGYANSQGMLGIMYRNGQGVPQDYVQAAAWYRKAADQGDADAQNSLGVLYENGQGLLQNRVQAHKWFNLSAARSSDPEGRNSATRNRDIVAARMTAQQIAEAQRLAREWRPGQALARSIPGSQLSLAAAQSRLAQMGLYTGAVDGIFGPATRAAILQFQRLRNLPQTGNLDDATTAALAR